MAIIPQLQTGKLVSGLDLDGILSNAGTSVLNGPVAIGMPIASPISLLSIKPNLLPSVSSIVSNLGIGADINMLTGIGLQVFGGGTGILVSGGVAMTANGLVVINGQTTINGACVINAAELENGPKVTNSLGITNGKKINSEGIIAPNATIPVVNGYCTGNKPFDIPHWKKKGKRVRHVCAEGPEAGIYIRGKLDGKNTIDLPEYWDGLVDPETITVNLTAYKRPQNLYVKDIQYGRRVIIGNEDGSMPTCFYEVWVARWIDPTNHDEELHVVYDGETPDDYPGNNENFLIGGWDYDKRNPQWEDSTETGSGA